MQIIAGLMKANVGLYEQAVADFQRVIELQPNNGDAYRRLGIVYGNTNQLKDAVAAFRRAIAVQPQNYRNYRELGAFYVDRDDYSQPFRCTSEMIELVPQMPEAHFLLGEALLGTGAVSRIGERTSDCHPLGRHVIQRTYLGLFTDAAG